MGVITKHRVLRPGTNCWKIAKSDRIAFAIDGKEYFDALASALDQAQRRIIIVAWDFDSRIRLQPDSDNERTLGEFLRDLVERKPDLSIHVLVWRGSVYYGSNPEFPGLPAGEWLAGDWLKHERIHFLLDAHHPMGSSHHQKIVCIDDTLAFAGGIDLTQGRWDTSQHLPGDPRRHELSEAHGPVHDIMMVVDGAAARALGECARERWRLAGGAPLQPLATAAAPWPTTTPPVLTSHDVAIARTLPEYGEQPEVREIEQLNTDCLLAARRSVYIENQYFATPAVAEILIEHLQRPDGPEIVIVVTCRSKGIVEQYVMAQTRDRLFAELRAADRYGRLRMFYPMSGPDDAGEIEIHSKLLIIDDCFLRIGSSNFNNRSLGVDTECDLAIEAANAAARRAIRRLRTRLISEHVGVRPAIFAAACRDLRSITRAIDWLNQCPRCLIPFDADVDPDSRPLPKAKDLLDPYRPLDLRYLWMSFTEASVSTTGSDTPEGGPPWRDSSA